MSCCGSLFVNLGGGGGGTVNTGVLQIAGGVALDSTLRFVEDQNGTDSLLKLSTTTFGIGNNITSDGTTINFLTLNSGISFYGTGVFFRSSLAQITYDCGNGTGPALHRFIKGKAFIDTGDGTSITQNGVLTVKGDGGNIVSFRSSANVEVASLTDSGQFITSSVTATGGTSRISTIRTSNINDDTNAITTFNIENTTGVITYFPSIFRYGGSTTSFPAIVATNTTPALAAKDATNTNLIPFSAEDFTSANLSAGTLNTARPMQFGDKGTVTTGNDLGLDAQIAVEHNGNVYYIPCSTVLLT
jgi:hypothetical protein